MFNTDSILARVSTDKVLFTELGTIYCEDAEKEPSPLMLVTGEDWTWENIKSFFLKNIERFEHEFGF